MRRFNEEGIHFGAEKTEEGGKSAGPVIKEIAEFGVAGHEPDKIGCGGTVLLIEDLHPSFQIIGDYFFIAAELKKKELRKKPDAVQEKNKYFEDGLYNTHK